MRKLLYLPQRSLLILSGEARYNWSHGIVQRRKDIVNQQLIPRGTRVSLTFRTALKPGPVPACRLQPGELELDHVVRVYDNIAVHWNHTRGKRKVYWHRVKDYLDSLPVGTLLADIGSGDGKYFGVNPGVISIGCDRSIKLLEVSHSSEYETFCCDAVKLPLTSDTFDATLCIGKCAFVCASVVLGSQFSFCIFVDIIYFILYSHFLCFALIFSHQRCCIICPQWIGVSQ